MVQNEDFCDAFLETIECGFTAARSKQSHGALNTSGLGECCVNVRKPGDMFPKYAHDTPNEVTCGSVEKRQKLMTVNFVRKRSQTIYEKSQATNGRIDDVTLLQPQFYVRRTLE